MLVMGITLHSFFTSVISGGTWTGSRPGRCTLEKHSPVTILYENGWAPLNFWKFWRREKYFASEVTEQTLLGFLAYSLKMISTTLIRVRLGKIRI
jgi:hypothetical protein